MLSRILIRTLVLFFCIFVLRSRKGFRIRSSVVLNVLDLNGIYSCGEAAYLTASVRLALPGSHTWQILPDGFRSARRGKSVDSADFSAMATVFPGAPMCAWVQREFEELLAVLIVSPVGGNGRLPTDREGSGQVPIYT